jgi:acyl-CoA reductase-like NAD-dependent aldehyde dehydrogenase
MANLADRPPLRNWLRWLLRAGSFGRFAQPVARPLNPAEPIPILPTLPLPAPLDPTVTLVRAAQEDWAARPVAARLAVIRRLRHGIAGAAGDLAAAAEVLTSEVLPLADACRFLEREAERLLAPRRLGTAGRPFWLGRVESEVRREPLGLVLLLGPANYPLFLPGVQAVQALAAGNAVLWKPGRSGGPAARALAGLLAAAGLPEHLLTVLPEGDEAGREAIAAGPDKILLTGSAATGQAVLAELAPRLLPAALELSGCDAVFVLPGCKGADLDRVARALRFGLTLNGGATCIAPRRVFVPRALRTALEERLVQLLGKDTQAISPLETSVARRARELAMEAISQGARRIAGTLGEGEPFHPLVLTGARPEMRLLKEDLFAPVLSLVEIDDLEAALAGAAACPYALGAAVFGPEAEAVAFAARVRAGVVVINDLVVPTADPRLPFGGRGRSGYGLTRGVEGLLELTAVKAVAVRRGAWLPHLDEPRPGDEALFRSYLALVHGGGWRARLGGLAGVCRALLRRGRVPRAPQRTALPQEGMS